MILSSGDFLKSISIFSHIALKNFKILLPFVRYHFYKKGTIILNDAQTQNNFLYVIKGYAKLFRESIEGDEIIVDVLADSHYSGEQFIFQADIDESYSVQAISDVEILIFPLQILHQLVKIDHQFAINLLQATLNKEQRLIMSVEQLSIQNAFERVGSFILKLCGSVQKKSITLRLPYDKSLLAAKLGMRVETFSRMLAKLGRECSIKIDGNTLHLADVKQLEAAVGNCYSKTHSKNK